MRFHLSFDYNGGKSWGDQVVMAESLEDAIRQIAKERKLSSIHIRARHHFGRPASEDEKIDKMFQWK